MAALAGDPPLAELAVNRQNFAGRAVVDLNLRDTVRCVYRRCKPRGEAQRQECCAARATGGGQ